MDEDTSSNYVYFTKAKDIWDDCKTMHSDLENTSHVFEIKSQLKEIRQGNLSVTKYYSDLKKLWQEIDLYSLIDPLCTDCNAMYKKKIQKEGVYEFLTCLKNDLDEARSRVINRDPFATTKEAFFDIRREETRKRAMLQKISQTTEKSALMVNIPSTGDNNVAFIANKSRSSSESKGGSGGNRRSE
ncbi:hypothetical protein LIER_16655 [Lithospermum erythrorhizon]|uniref:Retrotransposon gag domain-containing protein n=1 Tax=Lithospermum erythrorhizon TaxID=34254 RepID=A0AAV3Q8A0_LITER